MNDNDRIFSEQANQQKNCKIKYTFLHYTVTALNNE